MSMSATVSGSARSAGRIRPWCFRVTCGRYSSRGRTSIPHAERLECASSSAELPSVAHERDRHVAAAPEHRLVAGGGGIADAAGPMPSTPSSTRATSSAVSVVGKGSTSVTCRGHCEAVNSSPGEQPERQHDDEARHPASLAGARCVESRSGPQATVCGSSSLTHESQHRGGA